MQNVQKPGAEELRRLLLDHEGSVTRTAQACGVSRVTIYKWMRSYGIRRQSDFTQTAA